VVAIPLEMAHALAVSHVHQYERARKENNRYERCEKLESHMHSQIWNAVSGRSDFGAQLSSIIPRMKGLQSCLTMKNVLSKFRQTNMKHQASFRGRFLILRSRTYFLRTVPLSEVTLAAHRVICGGAAIQSLSERSVHSASRAHELGFFISRPSVAQLFLINGFSSVRKR
jgi:hypothetical protein